MSGFRCELNPATLLWAIYFGVDIRLVDANNENSERVFIVQRNEGTAAPTTRGSDLANTGSDSATLLAGAGGLVAIGYAMVATLRRRKVRR